MLKICIFFSTDIIPQVENSPRPHVIANTQNVDTLKILHKITFTLRVYGMNKDILCLDLCPILKISHYLNARIQNFKLWDASGSKNFK
jgi:hypothetical protein